MDTGKELYFGKKGILWAVMMGGPFGSAMSLGKNYQLLGQPNKKYMLYLGSMIYMFLTMLILDLPMFSFSDFFNGVFAGILGLLIPIYVPTQFALRYQIPVLQQQGVQEIDWFRAMLKGILSLIIVGGLYILMMVIMVSKTLPYTDFPSAITKPMIDNCKKELYRAVQQPNDNFPTTFKSYTVCLQHVGTPSAVAMIDCNNQALNAFKTNELGVIKMFLKECYKQKAPKMNPELHSDVF